MSGLALAGSNRSHFWRVFFIGGLISYRALFYWISPWQYIPTMLGAPLFQILFFVDLGRAAGVGSTNFFVVGNSIQICSMAGIYGMTMAIANERSFQTLSPILATPSNRLALFLGRGLPVLITALQTCLFGFLVSALLLDFRPSLPDLPGLALAVLVTSASCTGFGMALGSIGLRVRDVFLVSNIAYFLILDIMMPRLDGLSLTKELAGDNRRSLIILSARDETKDRILGLELGADDYLVKPFEFGELLARVRSVLRRRQPEQAALLQAGELEMDRAHRLTRYKGAAIELSPREFDLLSYLAEHRGEVLERDRILNSVWGVSFYGDDNNLEVYIRYLRRKLDDSDRRLIQTVRGVGYRLVAD